MNARVFGKYYLPYTVFSTQQKIASILSAYDSLIENNKKRIKLLEQMAENLYKEWFVRFRFPGYETVQFERGAPKGWITEKLGNVANIRTGKCNREDAEEGGIFPLFDRSQEIKKAIPGLWIARRSLSLEREPHSHQDTMKGSLIYTKDAIVLNPDRKEQVSSYFTC